MTIAIKKALLRLRDELQQQEAEFQKTNKPLELDQARLGRLSRMDAMQVQQMELETSRRRQRQLLKIDGALKRLEIGEYGFCFVCGDELDERRLKLEPTTTRCLSCVEE
jgi:DnaK suppressor protein